MIKFGEIGIISDKNEWCFYEVSVHFCVPSPMVIISRYKVQICVEISILKIGTKKPNHDTWNMK
jgi:hypothetical protein